MVYGIMCEHGNETLVRVKIAPHLSHTGKALWRDFGIDSCIAPVVKALQDGGIDMLASCCGHGKAEGRIDLCDGRTLVIVNQTQEKNNGKLRTSNTGRIKSQTHRMLATGLPASGVLTGLGGLAMVPTGLVANDSR